uniref:keratin, type I cytoskeletal 13-like n=1 Tax=Gasterosteus aculeatus aculeatus TaxID=481459 RepID=UPI001A98199C|nr:keratin, type I cytoskeletal 13-like [Gasterosteus aculeatus aculeatus]XP_040044206.1 keratin, type I cytoskeletal 13-like [Gasterosteus aculeatus aculeatus]
MSFSSVSYGQRTTSVYGGAGGRGTRISSSQQSYGHSSLSSSGGFNVTAGMDLHVGANEKATMQNLNHRLASYLEKVRTLEKENNHLEMQIRHYYQGKTVISPDYTSYFAIIEDLENKILIASKFNAKTILDMDNAKLAAEDFKLKQENEQAMRMAVEADISGLKKVLDEMNLVRMALEGRYEDLREDVITLKRNHEEELTLLRSQMSGQVNVAVDASPSQDMNQVMSEIRSHYESLISKNRIELEAWYQNQITTVEQDVISHSEDLVTARTEMKDLKSTLQRLQIDLQSHLSMKVSLAGTLEETQARYASQLAGLQNSVTSLEAQLSQLHANITSNKQDYDVLLDLKARLEMEIAEYRRLLDGEDESSKQVITKTITVVETVVDGKVVGTSKTVDVDVDEIE